MSKFQSISDVYKRQLLSELNPGEVEIYGKAGADNAPIEPIGTVSDTYYKVLKRTILTKGEGGVEAAIDELLSLGSWNTGSGGVKYANTVRKMVIDELVESNDIEIDPNEFTKFVDRKRKGDLISIESFIDSGKPFSILAALKSDIMPFCKQPEALLRAIWFISPMQKVVGVGPGEICISLFTNAGKGEVGDLQIAGLGEVELKSDNGRLGSDNFTHGIVEKYPRILKDRGADITLGNDIRSAQDQFEKHFRAAEWKIADLLVIFQNDPAIAEEQKINIANELGSLKLFLEDLYNLHFTKDDLLGKSGHLSVFENQLRSMEVYLPTGNDVWMIDHNVKSFSGWGLIQYIRGLFEWKLNLQDVMEKVPAPVSKDMTWNSAVQNMFLTDWGLKKADIVSQLSDVRTEPMFDSIGDLQRGIDKMLSDEDVKTMQKGGSTGREILKRVVQAIQLISYQHVHGFPYLLLCNAAGMQAIGLKFDTNKSVYEKFIDIYKQLVKNPRVTNNLNVDARNKGISMELKNIKQKK